MQNMQNIRNIKNICMKVFHDHIQDSKWYFSYRGIEFKLRQERIGSHHVWSVILLKELIFCHIYKKDFPIVIYSVQFYTNWRNEPRLKLITLRISIYCANIKSKNIEEKMYSNWRENIIFKICTIFFVNSHWKNGYTQVQYKRGRLQDHGNSGAEDGTS